MGQESRLEPLFGGGMLNVRPCRRIHARAAAAEARGLPSCCESKAPFSALFRLLLSPGLTRVLDSHGRPFPCVTEVSPKKNPPHNNEPELRFLQTKHLELFIWVHFHIIKFRII